MATEHRRRGVTAEEAKLWRDAMRGARPFPHRLPTEGETKADDAPAPPLPPANGPAPPLRPLRPPPPGKAAPPLAHGRSPGLDKNTAERLKKGAMAVDASLDLTDLPRRWRMPRWSASFTARPSWGAGACWW